MQPEKHQKRYKHPGIHNTTECTHKLHGQFIHYQPERATDGKETVQMKQAEEIRALLVPNTEPRDIPGILSKSEFLRLKKQARVLTPAEKKKLKEEAENKKVQLMEDSMKRKEIMNKAQLDQVPVKGSTLNEAETDAAKKGQSLLQRAFDLKQEQEDEIKGLNSIILASKCLTIREAQIYEKQIIQKEMEEEEKRLDMMMEQERQRGLRDEQRKRELEKKRKDIYISQIKQQLKENELQSLMDAERKEEEARLLNLALIAREQESQRQLQLKHEQQMKVQEEVKRNNVELEQFRALQLEEERMADARLKEFMRKKEEREAALEQEAKELKEKKERDIKRLQTAQGKAADVAAQREAMHVFRLEEEAERKWRQKELLEAQKKKEMNDNLKKERAKQTDDIRRAQALEIARDEEEFHKVAKLQYESFIREQIKVKERRNRADKHRREILQQVNEKERERIEMRRSKFEEGQSLKMEKAIRDMQIQETLKKKLEALRLNHVSEHSLNDIQRQAKATFDKINQK